MKKGLLVIIIILLLLGGCKEKEPEITLEYSQGQEVVFCDTSWRVLFDSYSNSNYVTLISSQLVYPESIYFDDDLFYMPIRYFTDVKLKYADSAIKLYLEEEVLPLYGDSNLIEINGYKIRLLTLNDLKNVMPLEVYTDDNQLVHYRQADSEDYSWLINKNEWFWTMEECADDLPYIVYGESSFDEYNHYSWYALTNSDVIEFTSVGQRNDDSIKIVINVYKSALKSTSGKN